MVSSSDALQNHGKPDLILRRANLRSVSVPYLHREEKAHRLTESYLRLVEISQDR
jgi:hypothetical protein